MKNPASAILNAVKTTTDLLDGDVLDRLRALLAQPKTKSDDFLKILPPESILAIVTSSNARSRHEGLPDAILREMTELEDLIKREIPGLQGDQNFKKAVIASARQLGVESDDASEPIGKSQSAGLDSISSITASPLLIGVDAPLIPSFRIILRTEKGKEFESFANALDLSFVASGFIGCLAQMLEQRLALLKQGVVHVSKLKVVAKNIRKIEESLDKIKRLAPDYGIELSGSDIKGDT